MSPSSSVRRLIYSSLVVALILTAAIIIEGPPTLTNRVLAQEDASAILARYGYYYYTPVCYPYPYCSFIPMLMRQFSR